MPPEARPGAEEGNAGLVMVAGVAIVMILLLGLGDLSAFFVARTKAQTAADSAALAAVAELIPSIGKDAEAVAQEYAKANGGQLLECRCSMSGSTVEVTVSVPVRMTLRQLSGVKVVKAHAKAEINLPKGSG